MLVMSNRRWVLVLVGTLALGVICGVFGTVVIHGRISGTVAVALLGIAAIPVTSLATTLANEHVADRSADRSAGEARKFVIT